MNHIRVKTPFDECDYQVVKEIPGQSETVAGYTYDQCVEADEHCMSLNRELQDRNIPDSEICYSLEMGPNVPEPE